MRDRDDGALRVTNLMFTLYGSPSPLTTEQIVSDSDLGYGSDNRDSDLKKFRRDRAQLAACGVHVKEIRDKGASKTEESSWAIDRERSYADGRVLAPEDAEALDAVLEGQLARPGLPYRAVLTGIRTKLREASGLGGAATTPARLEGANDAAADAVWAAFSLRRLLPLLYRDAAGRETRRTVAVYGVFTIGGLCYFVGRNEDSGKVRTFRTDRVERVWRPRGCYAVPEGFRVEDYLFLPFDFAPGEGDEVSLTVPAGVGQAELEVLTRRRGALERRADGGWAWRVRARDLRAAAAFGLAHARLGMRPESPPELLDEWNRMLDWEVSAHAHDRRTTCTGG